MAGRRWQGTGTLLDFKVGVPVIEPVSCQPRGREDGQGMSHNRQPSTCRQDKAAAAAPYRLQTAVQPKWTYVCHILVVMVVG